MSVRFVLLFACVLACQCTSAKETDRAPSQGDETSDPIEQSGPALPTSSSSGNLLPATDDQWRYSIAFPMLWAPQIKGKVRGAERLDFNIEFKDI